MKVTYRGPHDRVWLPALGAYVARNTTVDVDDTTGESLVAQGWDAPAIGPDADTVAGWLEWAGDDPERIEHAINREQDRAKPRTSLVDELRDRMAAITDTDPGDAGTQED